ncbi:MAG: helix-turn-helix transcriptional regulator [Candidatus Accumulibacter sp.]|nr:helix-turn-helix transcriptional regulator [Accumulibacter sp.]
MRANLKQKNQKREASSPGTSHNEAFGTVLARLRRDRTWSQELLGFESNRTRAYISLLEQGKRSPTLDTQMALCNALNVSLEEVARLVLAEMQRRSQGPLCG